MRKDTMKIVALASMGWYLKGGPSASVHANPSKSFPVMSFGRSEPWTNSTSLSFAANWCKIPEPSKAFKGGEDACFTDAVSLAVADGVGGWAKRGIDPSKYSNALISTIQSLSESASEERERDARYTALDPTRLITQAWEYSRNIMGSTTICTATIFDSELRIANIGDSGAIVLRPVGDTLLVLSRTKEQVFRFNFPFQIGGYQEKPDESSVSHPSISQKISLQVQPGDIIVIGSDGLFDNVFDKEIIAIVTAAHLEKNLPAGGSPQDNRENNIAVKIASVAFENSRNKYFSSPFQHAAMQEGLEWVGGKSDDITVVVGVVVTPKPRARL